MIDTSHFKGKYELEEENIEGYCCLTNKPEINCPGEDKCWLFQMYQKTTPLTLQE